MACQSNDRWGLIAHRVEHKAMVLLFERRSLGFFGLDVFVRTAGEILKPFLLAEQVFIFGKGFAASEPTQAVDTPAGHSLVCSRTWATQIVPSAGIDDQNRAVGIEKKIDRMEVDSIRGDQGERLGSIVRLVAALCEAVKADLMQVELSAKQKA